jgi:hypothetical protein
MVQTGEGTRLNHAVEGEIDLSDAAEEPDVSASKLSVPPLVTASRKLWVLPQTRS